MTAGSPSGPAYVREISEAAEKETDDIYLRISSYSPDRARDWFVGLLAAYERLIVFPYQYQAAPEYGAQFRRMLYGTGAQRYRVLYIVIEPDVALGETQGMVRILHLVHGAHRKPGGPEEENRP